jgi:hypothetical protein
MTARGGSSAREFLLPTMLDVICWAHPVAMPVGDLC